MQNNTYIYSVCTHKRYKCYFQQEGSCNLSTSKVETYHMWIPRTLPKEDDISKQLVYDSMLTFKKNLPYLCVIIVRSPFHISRDCCSDQYFFFFLYTC